MNYVTELTMNNGLKAKIIKINGVHDIDIIFENGIIVRHKDYYRFLLGQIKCPMIYTEIGDYIKCENPNTGDLFSIDKEDLEIVKKEKFWHIDKSNGYVRTGKGIKLHRLIMKCDKNLCVDHINGIRNDNRKINLRICSHNENAKNLKLSTLSSTGFKGVTRRGNKFRAKITNNGKQICLGTFENITDAINAYDLANVLYFGKYASPNITKEIPTKPSWLK